MYRPKKCLQCGGKAPTYQKGGSIYDYMTSKGLDGSFAHRKKVFNNYFDGKYTGSAEQNLELLSKLKSGEMAMANSRKKVASEKPVPYTASVLRKEEKRPDILGYNPNPVQNKQVFTGKILQKPQKESTATTVYKNPINIPEPTPAAMSLGDYGTMGINYIKRIYDKYRGDEGAPVSKIPTPSPKPTAEKEVLQAPPIVTGDTIWDNSRVYHIPEKIDLGRVKFGARNRGENKTVESTGLAFTNFDNNKVVSSKSTKLNPAQVYIGVDQEGNMKTGTGDMFTDKEYQLSPFYSHMVRGFSKSKEGNYELQRADHAAKNHSIPLLEGTSNNRVPINLLVKNGQSGNTNTFGNITGGRAVFTSPDFSKQVMFSGSVKNIDDQLQGWMKENKLDSTRYIPVDNGSYSRGYRTKDGQMTEADWKANDLRNSSGGHGFYIKGKGYQYGGITVPEPKIDLTPGKDVPFDYDPSVLRGNKIKTNPVQDAITKGIIETPPGFESAQAAYDYYNAATPKKGFNPLPWQQGLDAATVGLTELSGRVERGRQNQYMYNQLSTLGQMNPMPANDYQPNPYSLYARYGGSLKKYMK